jgi:hypothetical protein
VLPVRSISANVEGGTALALHSEPFSVPPNATKAIGAHTGEIHKKYQVASEKKIDQAAEFG